MVVDGLEVVQFPGFTEGDPFQDVLVPYKDTFELNFGFDTHPVLADCLPCTKLWVKIDDHGVVGRIVGRINKEHRFTAMADFQPLDPVSGEPEGESLEERILSIAACINENRTGDTESVLPNPPLFSTETVPRSLADFYFSPARQPDRTRSSRQEIPWFCYFSDPGTFWGVLTVCVAVPACPAREAVERARLVPPELRQELNGLLEQRPIISKLAVYCMASSALKHHLKALLPSVCYYFVNGPWRLTWVRYGLDPRQSADHRRLQVLECRNMYRTSRSAAAQKQGRGRRGGVQQAKKSPLAPSDAPFPSNGYLFDGVTLNGNFFMYQLCDLVYRETRDIVDDPELVSAQVSEKEGWYKDGTLARLREIIKRRWLDLRAKTLAPSYADFEREQADLEDILFPDSALSQTGIDSFDSSMFANILTRGGDGVPSDTDEFFIFDE